MMHQYKVHFESFPWQSSLPHARSKAFQAAGKQIRLVEFARGFVEPDWCLKGHVGYVLDGEMNVDFYGTVIRFSAGDGFIIPPGQENRHKASVLTDAVRLILVEDI
jgi:quercetin dioxygenase-like cupin family protein